MPDFLPFNDDPLDNRLLKPPTEIQENEHFVVLNDQCFQYLFGIYGGVDVRRNSIQVEEIEEEDDQEINTTMRSSTKD